MPRFFQLIKKYIICKYTIYIIYGSIYIKKETYLVCLEPIISLKYILFIKYLFLYHDTFQLNVKYTAGDTTGDTAGDTVFPYFICIL